jgi:hypothetical protein
MSYLVQESFAAWINVSLAGKGVDMIKRHISSFPFPWGVPCLAVILS